GAIQTFPLDLCEEVRRLRRHERGAKGERQGHGQLKPAASHDGSACARILRILASRSEAKGSLSRRCCSSITARSCGSKIARSLLRWRICCSATRASYTDRASAMAAFCSSDSFGSVTPLSASLLSKRSLTSSSALLGASVIRSLRCVSGQACEDSPPAPPGSRPSAGRRLSFPPPQ